MQWPARRLQIFGIHYHVGVRSAEKSIVIANALQFYLAHLLALSASSPYWEGHDTGLASCRVEGVRGTADRRPPAGHRGLGRLRAVHAHARRGRGDQDDPRGVVGRAPAPRTSAPSSCASATRCRRCARSRRSARSCSASCSGSTAQIDAGEPVYIPREWTIRQNKWLAARHGLDAKLIVDDDGTPGVTARDVDRRMLDASSMPIGERARVRRRARRRGARSSRSAPSYVRQRAVVDARAATSTTSSSRSSRSSRPTSREPDELTADVRAGLDQRARRVPRRATSRS